MKTKILVGSIGAGVILILVSFTNVVGVQSTTSGSVNESPLFSIRTKKAIHKEGKTVLTSDYLGKGRGNVLQFPTRDNKIESLIKIIECISKMDDKTFEHVVELCMKRIKQDGTIGTSDMNNVINLLYQLRTKPDIFYSGLIGLINRTNQSLTSSNSYTICNWFPGCIPLFILLYLYDVITFVVIFLFVVLVTVINNPCGPP